MAADTFGTAPPETIANRPALSAIRYRIGTYGTFRRAMLEQIARWERPVDDAEATTIRPLQEWTTRAEDDFGIAFLEMWAYLGDILTFYQERIANEAFLRTAVREESTTFIVSLVGYRPSPGKAAATYLAFKTEQSGTVRLDTGLLVQSVPGQDEEPQKFETIETISAYPSLNELRPRTKQDQTLSRGATRVVLAGAGHRLEEGDWFVIAGDERRGDPGSERWDLRRAATVVEDKNEQTTTVTWREGLGQSARPWRRAIDPEPNPEFWVFRGTAWPFGYNAPDYNLFTSSVPEVAAAFTAVYTDDWNDKYLPEDSDHADHLYLDTVYPGIADGDWVALVTSRIDPLVHPNLSGYEQYAELYPVRSVADTAWRNYTLTAKSTRLTLDRMTTGADAERPEHIGYFPIQGTVALIQSERIALAQVPIGFSAGDPDADRLAPVQGTWIELDEVYPDLEVGRSLLVTGTLIDAQGTSPGTGSEVVVIAIVEHADRTTIRFATSMSGSYDRSSVVIHGNVAMATHGQTVAAEALGDGDASAEFQTFTLKKSPVTFVPSPGAAGGAASTLTVRVDGVKWTETAEFYGHDGDARVFVTRRDVDQAMLARFGDGTTGARLVSGRNNVQATYRVGLGPDGNVRAETLRTLLKKPLGLKSVTNPAAAAGGADSEDPAQVKDNAPGTVRTFGRIVSLQDFEDAAREYIGVAKARASFVWDGEGRVVRLIVAGDGGAQVDVTSGLQADLDARRDPRQPLEIENYNRVYVLVRLSIIVDDAYQLDAVSAAADTALRAIFAFDALRLGQSIPLSTVYRAVQDVAGVAAVDVDEFGIKDQAAGTSVARLVIAPGELAWVEQAADLAVTSARFESKEAS